MSRAIRTLLALSSLAALALAFSACGKKAPVAPVVLAPPKVVGVQPAARSTGYAYDGQIWALFDRALDPKSVDTTTVFLKQDTQRVPSTVSYEGLNHRIVIVPRVTLQLSKAYTVILSARVRGKDGIALGQDYSWQFITNSIRRVSYDLPAAGALVSPVAMMQWTSADATPGNLVYDIYAGADSAAVAGRTAPIVSHGGYNFYLPRTYWPAGARLYWAVTTRNIATGERLDSPVTSFDVYPASAPTFDTVVSMSDFGGLIAGGRTQLCSASSLPVGPAYNAAVRFALASAPYGYNVAHARITMTATFGQTWITGMGLWYATSTWNACAVGNPGPPFADPNGLLATATTTTGTDIVFDSAGLAAFIEGAKKFPTFNGFVLTGSSNLVNVNTIGAGFPQPLLVVTSYQ